MGTDAPGFRGSERPMKMLPHDQAERDRFAKELDQNFSVIAAAGTGKTAAITDRIVQIAQQKPERLPHLVVVTFTNRAADEMQQRARQRIFEGGVSLEILTAFNRAFFGTIHSFCTKLLAVHGHHLGLPSRLELISDDEQLWNEFVQRTNSVGHSLSPESRKALLRHVQLRDLLELGRRGKLPLALERRDLECPKTVDLAPLYNFPAQANWTRIIALKEVVRDWEEQFDTGTGFLPLIECTPEGRFREQWEETFREFNEWLSCCALKVAAEVQANYRHFRAERGAVTFDDQIALALELTNNREAISRIRAKDYIVILDEAQDTDPQQFSILTEITRPQRAAGRWIENLQDAPRPGRFCMVGDFQQSIYGDRADLTQYRRVHGALVRSDAGEALEFSVTFRLDEKQVDFVNECFRDVLSNVDGQVGFIELKPRPEKLPGQVVRLDITPEILKRNPDASEMEKTEGEAAQLANWIAQTGCETLRARAWGQVAILCPRKKWFRPVGEALRRVGIDSQVQSETDVKGDSPAHAWFTALLTIMTQPRFSFEIVGVLREVFGISDHDLAVFADRHSEGFQIETPARGGDVVSETLDLLARVHAEIADKPLFTAVEGIVESTRLRAHLQTLPAEDFENLDAELDVLLQTAATAEAEGATLEEFGELLRANFTTEREASAPRADAIQLITCQKAKGLEWDAVIVPFFSHPIYTRDDDFPRIIAAPGDQQAIVAFNKADVPAEKKDTLKKAQVQEMERLMYVALTRARHTLVLAGDRELFAKADGTAPSASLTKWFRSDRGQPNEPHVFRLSAKASGCTKTRDYQLRLAPRLENERQQIADLPRPSFASARRRAENFFLKINPSRFTPAEPAVERTGAAAWKETESEFRARILPSPATRYGIWWHEFTQQIPWKADPGAWDQTFEDARLISPDKARSAREWKELRRQISKLSDFPSRFANGAPIAHAEMPFFWRMDENQCLEGIVDLAFFELSQKKWFILDWKTNRITPDKIDILRAHYRPQIAAYWKAVAEIAGVSVTAGIYSTSTGKFIAYGDDELASEWERLRTLPPEEIAAEIVVDVERSPVQLEFAALSDRARRG
jgi:ATP-dependent helicase/nuclease subunit A